MKHQCKLRKSFIILLLILNTLGLNAQQTFKYQATVQKVDSNGFYRITLMPNLLAKCKADLSDLRLIDQNGKFNPYVFGNQIPCSTDIKNFIIFPQVKAPEKTDTATIFIAENKDQVLTDQLWLKLRNASVQRTANLSGSDDLIKWYAIKENITLSEAVSNASGVFEQVLNFPSSTYRYLKIQINHAHKDPIAILQAGVYLEQLTKPTLVSILKPTFTQTNSSKLSQIKIKFNEDYQIDGLHFEIKGSKYFKRNIRVYQIKNKGRSLVSDTLICSTGTQDLNFSTKGKEFDIEILNEDNMPLTIKSVKGFELNQSIIGYFEKEKSYQILFGDEKALSPNYDLKFFTDSLNHKLPEIKYYSIVYNPLYKINPQKKTLIISRWLIWVCVTITIGILTLLTLKMMQEVNKRAEKN